MGWIKGELLADGMISPNDLDLLFVTDDLDEAVERVRHGYQQRSSETETPAAPVKADAQ
jgi:predicted Rossmann-fold nucleotide-binding protein